ncbi:hypothetical protein [Pseudocitrobacter sp. 73]|uniref:hypothetical protein n=1 Tax=Pseudocitrobacter sp. 73 TaxID=2605731 RepID=UPI0011EE2687|nr:hypothetical protein [Pseudocitrobacter sp. 73]KAA1049224.1 hypothetical protein F0Q32_12955 [Pseudocitrobacter sp. 73]
MTLSFTFFILYLLTSLAMLLLQIWCFALNMFLCANSLILFWIYHLVVIALEGFQIYLARSGRFPFELMASQNHFVDDTVRILAVIFFVFHMLVTLLLRLITAYKSEWRD